MKYIIVVGNPVSGLGFVGPFPTHGEATEYAAAALDQWWIAEIITPGKA